MEVGFLFGEPGVVIRLQLHAVLTPFTSASLIAGYDTGQISQILLFNDFIDRFGQTNAQGEKEFKSIVASLLVSLMSIGECIDP
jgi:hypothetical protein